MTILVVDTFDLYRRVKRKFDAKIDFAEFVAKLGDIKLKSFAYGMSSEKNFSFEACLRALGFQTKFKRPRILRSVKLCDWGVGMTLDIVDTVDENDTVIFGTCNLQIIPIIRWLKKNKSVKVVIYGVDVPEALEHLANSTIEITEELLEYADDT